MLASTTMVLGVVLGIVFTPLGVVAGASTAVSQMGSSIFSNVKSVSPSMNLCLIRRSISTPKMAPATLSVALSNALSYFLISYKRVSFSIFRFYLSLVLPALFRSPPSWVRTRLRVRTFVEARLEATTASLKR